MYSACLGVRCMDGFAPPPAPPALLVFHTLAACSLRPLVGLVGLGVVNSVRGRHLTDDERENGNVLGTVPHNVLPDLSVEVA